VAVTVSELIACLEKLDPTATVTVAHEDCVDFENPASAGELTEMISRANGDVTILYCDALDVYDPDDPDLSQRTDTENIGTTAPLEESLDDCE
jgi:hypothetical protein